MLYKIITPSEPVIPVAELRLHLRIDADTTEENALLASYLEAARDYAEHYTARSIGERTLEMAFETFADKVELFGGPVESITAVTYKDVSGASQTVNPVIYELDNFQTRSYVRLASGRTWPAVGTAFKNIRVRYQAGLMTPAVRSALLLLVGDLYEKRENSTTTQNYEVPYGVRVLLNSVKVWHV